MKEDKEELEQRLINETINLNLSLKKKSYSSLSTSENDKKSENESDLLFKKLEKKWGLDKINETEEEKEFMNNLLDKSMHLNSENKINN